MEATLYRTGSTPVHNLNRTHSGSGKSTPTSSPRVSCRSMTSKGYGGLKRSSSDTDMVRSELGSRIGRVGSVSFPDMSVIVEEESWELSEGVGFGIGNGKGSGNHVGGGGKSGNHNNNDNKNNKLGEYYLEMLKSNPGDSLLLRNYGKYLHEVEKNVEKAEEYYGRAILASPGDGELLSLYANLIWETQRDEDRAQSYFYQAVHASPDDSMVLGSYAHFLWGAEEDEEDEEIKHSNAVVPAMVGAHYPSEGII